MKLHEEFKLYENLWESMENVTVFVANEQNEDVLLDEVTKLKPHHMTIVYEIKDILRSFDLGELTKVYTDAEGRAELEKVCTDFPVHLKSKLLDKVVQLDLATAKDSLDEARKVNPTPPATLDIIKIEPNIQDAYGSGKWRHYDEITYMDPYLNVERKASVWEENPGFGKYFGWGSAHSGHWNYAAYDYDGKLLPDIDPNAHISTDMKKAISGIVNKTNNPSENDED